MDNGVAELSLAHFTRGNSVARDTFCKELIRRFQGDGFIVLRDHPVPSALLDGAKYSDIRAGDFLEQRLRDIGLLETAVPEGR
jgi:isopenicillin N synthase-like dioxygenase